MNTHKPRLSIPPKATPLHQPPTRKEQPMPKKNTTFEAAFINALVNDLGLGIVEHEDGSKSIVFNKDNVVENDPEVLSNSLKLLAKFIEKASKLAPYFTEFDFSLNFALDEEGEG